MGEFPELKITEFQELQERPEILIQIGYLNGPTFYLLVSLSSDQISSLN